MLFADSILTIMKYWVTHVNVDASTVLQMKDLATDLCESPQTSKPMKDLARQLIVATTACVSASPLR